jgi:microcystin-dependent protein
MPPKASKQTRTQTAIYGSLFLNDGTKDQDGTNFIPVRPSYTGDLKYSVLTEDHHGWLKCDGRALSRTLYSKLWDAIGTAFGSGDGSTTFNLPDCRGRVLGGVGQGAGLTNRTIGSSVGAETHTLTVDEIPSHSHGVTDPGHTHTYLGLQSQGVASGLDSAAENSPRPTETSGSSTTGISINNTGGGGAHNNMQPTIFASSIFIFAQ